MTKVEQSDSSPGRNSRGCGTIFFIIMIILSAVWGGMLGGFVWLLEDTKTTIAALEEFRPKVGSRIYAADGALLGEFTRESRQLVNLNGTPLNLQKAFIATEDDTFYEHKGIRPDAMLNAARYIIQTGRLRGGSTITQQLVRNVEDVTGSVTGITKEQTVKRKLREMLVALQVERQFTKDEILELYLNVLFLGISAHGVEAASQQYFAKPVQDLTLSECAMMAGLARAPNAQEPFRHFENALKRRNVVLGQMLENEFISQEQYDDAIADDLAVSVVTPSERAQLLAEGKGVLPPNTFKAPYFVEEARKMLLRHYTEDELYYGGLEIHTTLDSAMQEAAEAAMFGHLDTFDEKKLAGLTKANQADQFKPVSGALVCLDNRAGSEGYVRAMVGGRDFHNEQYNTVTQAHRQAGSSVKPFVWAAAIDNGYTAANIEVDEPFVYVDAIGNVWQPKNFNGEFLGPITLRRAIRSSVNVVSIKILQGLTMPLVRSYIERSGIRTPIDNTVGLTLALGTHLVTPMEQAVAYSTFANGGMRHQPTLITEVRNRDGFVNRFTGDLIDERPTRVLPENVAYVVTNLLEGVAQDGTGWRSRPLARPRAGKTGTTNESKDVWFCGFTPDFTGIVWVGYRNPESLGRGSPYTGGSIACPIWTDFMMPVHDGLPIREFDVPEGVQFYNIDRETGLAGGSFREAFLTGTKPPEEWPVFFDDIDLEDLLSGIDGPPLDEW
jgi:penicillin-binding protein 1A